MIYLPWILLFLPLLVAASNHLLFCKSTLAPVLSVISAAATFVIAMALLKTEASAEFSWATVGDFSINFGIKLDRLSTGMMIIVTGIGLLVHIFSIAYMKEDDAKPRYFTGLSLFMFSMTGIVLSSNFLMTFIFWELVGLSSYLLIGHWYHKPSAADAAKKAFLCNRVGDFGFMIGILLLWGITGTFSFPEMHAALETFTNSNANYFVTNPAAFGSLLSLAFLCIFCGAIGKSAQLPLHVWLPDAMEGPTPVSALIHAATMVAAGVYMLFRLQLSLALPEGVWDSLFSSHAIAWTGGITSLFAALMATQQDDIKRILAYSTLSQLGYMIMAVGLGSGESGMFHLFTHAWFKALLFLGSGAVIYACHHEQNIWKMGGLLKKIPITGLTFTIGTAALIAVPYITSGFWSKEEILSAAYHRSMPLFIIGVLVAFLTTFYMTRLYVIAFLGKSRNHAAEHAHEVGPLMFIPLLLLAAMAIISGFPFLTESLNAIRPHLEHLDGHKVVLGSSLSALVLGIVCSFFLYRGKSKDPLIIPLFQQRFYIDKFYDNFIVRYFQDAWSAIVHFFDEFFINGVFVGGISRTVESCGNAFRKIQSGSLQTYAFAIGVGVLAVIYLTLSH